MPFASFPLKCSQEFTAVAGNQKVQQLLGKANGYKFDADSTNYGYIRTDPGGLRFTLVRELQLGKVGTPLIPGING